MRKCHRAYRLFADQTGLVIVTPGTASTSEDDEIFRVTNNGNDKGIAQLAITITKAASIEVLRVDIDFASPLQLAYPDRRGFFSASGNIDEVGFPFRLSWQGKEVVIMNVLQVFAVEAHFPSADFGGLIRITVHGRRKILGLGSYLTHGSVQVKTFTRSLELVVEPIGIRIQPGCSMTSPQPLFVEGAFFALGPSQVAVHEMLKAGKVASHTVSISLDLDVPTK